MRLGESTIRKLRSEFAHRFKLDNDFRVDCDKAKIFFEYEYPASNRNSILGYIHDIILILSEQFF